MTQPTENVIHHWRVTFLLSVVTFVAYLVRSDIAVAQERMVPAIGLTMAGMGAVTAWAFQLSYAVFQVPAGIFGQRVGVRSALAAALLGCSVASLVTSGVPADSALPVLVFTRVLLGVAQAAVFPVAAMAVMVYVPIEDRVRATAIYIATSALGAAAAPLLMAPVMERFGWRAVFALSGFIAIAVAFAWIAAMPPRPERHTNHREDATPKLMVLAGDRRLLLLSLSYLLHSAVWFVFVFWFFRYLTDGRGFTILASGVWGSLPSIAAFVLSPLIGVAADRLGRRIGPGRARRRVAMACLLSAAGFVTVGAVVPSAVFAVLALSLSSGCVNGAEAPFFMTATAIGGSHPAAAAGVLNLMGNLGGVFSIWLVPRMSDAWGWNATLVFWSAACIAAALLWLTVDVQRGGVA